MGHPEDRELTVSDASAPDPPTGPAATVLADPVLDRRLVSEGYVVMPFISGAEVHELRCAHAHLVDELEPASAEGGGLVIDFMRTRRSMMRGVKDLLDPMWSKHLPDAFLGYEPVVSTFVVKHPGPSSVMKLHHEPTFSELGVPTFNIWIPLVDVGPETGNGALELVPGTQELGYGFVGFDTPVLFRPYEDFVVRHGVVLDVPAGSAVVYDTRMLHRSAPNLSDRVRPAVAAALSPRESPILHVVSAGPRKGHVYSVDREFFLDLHPAEVPEQIGRRYDFVREVDIPAGLQAEEVARVVGSPEVPAPEVLIPEDVASGRDVGLVPRQKVYARVERVPELPAADVGPLGDTGLSVSSVAGGVSALTLARGWRSWERDFAMTTGRSPFSRLRDAIGIELAAGSRLSVELLWRRGGQLTVQDCTPLASGLLVGDRAMQFEAGRSTDVPRGREVTMWNEGPGPATLVIWRCESPLDVLRSALVRS